MPADEFPVQFEAVTTHSNYEVKRLRILGGWLVMVRDSTNDITSSLLVPDPQGEWILES